MNFCLRNYETGDESFHATIFYEARSTDFLLAGMSEMQIKPLVELQFRAQNQSYQDAFPNAEHLIIELGGESIGRLLINRDGEKIHLIDIAVLSAFRGRGVGGAILEKLKSEAEIISLSVFNTNFGARRLFEKYGFARTGNDGMYLRMEWKNVG